MGDGREIRGLREEREIISHFGQSVVLLSRHKVQKRTLQ